MTTKNKFRASDGLGLSYYVDDYTDPWRQSDTLVMVHAAMGNANRFYAWVPHLARNFRVVRLELRGHGDSEIPGPTQLTFERLTKDVIELLNHLGVAKAHLMGSSAGAFVSQSVAANYPQRISTLACFAATPGMKKGTHDYKSWVTRIGASGVAAFLRETIRDRINVDAVEPGFVDWFIAESARAPVEVLARIVPLMAGMDLSPELPKIQCTTLVVVPGGDPIHTVEEYRVLERLIPKCEFIVYAGMPHNITDAVPDRCAAELKRFLLAHA
jgi:pimeloyl-ACP methyl ester carboxylesterase